MKQEKGREEMKREDRGKDMKGELVGQQEKEWNEKRRTGEERRAEVSG